MSSRPVLRREAETLLRALTEEKVAPLDPGAARDLRAKIVAHIDEQRARAAKRRAVIQRWRRRALFAAAACLPVLIGATMVLWSRRDARLLSAVQVTALSGSAEIAQGAVERPLAAATPTRIEDSEELVTGPDGLARASLPTGALVQVGPRARVRFSRVRGAGQPLGDRVELLGGRVDVQVPKLVHGEEVSVQTAGVTVVVHGTKFSVEQVAPSGETRVVVTEGTVAVYFGHEERLLTAGASLVVPADVAWSTPNQMNAAPSDPSSGGPDRVERPSTLGAENGMLSSAMQLRREGDPKEARALLDELLGRFPGSPLTEIARVERMRALRDMRAEDAARREAERYLIDYPQGFAREEAMHLAKPRPHPK